MRYARPRTLEEALSLLAEGSWRILAGGTDFYPAQGARPILDDVLDIGGLAELRGIDLSEHGITIRGRTTWTDIVRASHMPTACDMLRQAAREVGAIQIQTTGTVAGNLCNASPAADGVPPLLALDAEVELRSLGGVRRLALADFILGNRRTARRADELLTAVHIPVASTAGRSRFVKLGARRYLVISVAMVAARIAIEEEVVTQAAIAIGACSVVAKRMTGLEGALCGAGVHELPSIIADPAHYADLAPIDDVRGTAEYRREAAGELVRRAVEDALFPEGREVAA